MDPVPAEAPLKWRPTALARGLATCAASALVIALAGGVWQLAVFAAPFLAVLAAQGWFMAGAHAPPRRVTATAEPGTIRTFENEPTTLTYRAEAGGPAGEVTVTPLAQRGLLVGSPVPADTEVPELGAAEPAHGVGDAEGRCALSVSRWGNYTVHVRVDVAAPGGLLTATARLPVAQVRGYPLVSPSQTAIPRAWLPDRLGTHLTRRHGTGVEYADTRVYVPGDQLHSINWPVSSRTGQLQVTERFTDRSADLLLIIDTYPHASGPASDSLERSVNGATQVALSALQRGDRAGVIALGGRARWLGPELGRRQFYRILDAVLDAGEDHRAITGTLAPRAALPPGAIVIGFSPLLEPAFTLALVDLHRRGHPVVLVDVLSGRTPFTETVDPVAERIWRIERRNQYRDLAVIGIDVISWDEGTNLGHNLRLLATNAPRRRNRR